MVLNCHVSLLFIILTRADETGQSDAIIHAIMAL
jgi:hypothetical protein